MQWELSGRQILKRLIIHKSTSCSTFCLPEPVCLSLSIHSDITHTQKRPFSSSSSSFHNTAKRLGLYSACVARPSWPMPPPFCGDGKKKSNVMRSLSHVIQSESLSGSLPREIIKGKKPW